MEILIDEDVYAALKARATHPREGLNAVLRRVLREHFTQRPRTDVTPNGGKSHAAGLYARVSTTDKDQNPETQLVPLREFTQVQGWAIAVELIDTASATDLRRRTA